MFPKPQGLSKKRTNVFSSTSSLTHAKAKELKKEVNGDIIEELNVGDAELLNESKSITVPVEKEVQRTILDDIIEYKRRYPTLEDELANLPDVCNDHMTDEQIHLLAVKLAKSWGYTESGHQDYNSLSLVGRPPTLGLGAHIDEMEALPVDFEGNVIYPERKGTRKKELASVGTQVHIIKGMHSGLSGIISGFQDQTVLVKLDLSDAIVSVDQADISLEPISDESHNIDDSNNVINDDESNNRLKDWIQVHQLVRITSRTWKSGSLYYHQAHVLDVNMDEKNDDQMINITAKDLVNGQLLQIPLGADQLLLSPCEPTGMDQLVCVITPDDANTERGELGTVSYYQSTDPLVTVQLHRDGSFVTRPRGHFCRIFPPHHH